MVPRMNLHQRASEPERPIPVVEGPDGVRRRAFSADDVRRMTEIGILGENDPFELVDGELIAMAAKGFAHDRLKMALAGELFRALDRGFYVAVECTLRLGPDTLLEPDILVCKDVAVRRSPEGYVEVPGPDILLLIEVSDSSLAYDRRQKALVYASHDLPEYWVVDIGGNRTWVHCGPQGATYRDVRPAPGSELLRARAPALAPFGLRLLDLS